MNEVRDIIKPMMSDANTTHWKVGWASVSALLGSLLTSPIDWLKNAFVFHPNTQVQTSPTEYGLPYEEVWFGGADDRLLHGWYVPNHQTATGTSDPLFIWFHGNAGNVSHRLAHLRLLRERVGGDHFLFDYQGFGRSRGKPSIAGILDDGRAAIAYAQRRGWNANRPVVYFGESLGAAVVVTLALETAPSHAVLLAPFLSLRAMGEIRLPPLAFLVDGELNSARLVERFPAPLLVIHGTADRTIPFQQGQGLYTLAPHPKRFYAIEGAGHTNLHEAGGETYIRVLREFLTSAPTE
ncbi:MAG: alpha/beta hydrolase [Deltaproteobacteria bacterium]|nr:alpha/beta hydrolase [Deltaproteobacteria bacterium]